MISTMQDRSRLAGGADNRWEVMTRLYRDRLEALLSRLEPVASAAAELEVRHFFNGAALYVDGVMCVSWSPVGLAFRLDADEVARLIDSGQALPLKYFAKGHIKPGFALFENPGDKSDSSLKRYFMRAIEQAEAGA